MSVKVVEKVCICLFILYRWTIPAKEKTSRYYSR